VPVIDEDAAVRGTTFFVTTSNMHWIVFVVPYKRGLSFVMKGFYSKASSHDICKCAFSGTGNFAPKLGSRSAQLLQNTFHV